MKKSTLLLSLALVFVLSVGAFAQLNTAIKGYVETDITFRQENPNVKTSPFKMYAKTRTEVTLSMSASGKSGNISASVSMTGAERKPGWEEWTGGIGGTGSSIPFTIGTVKMTATGAWWKNGPSLTVTAGEHSVSYSKYTANGVGARGLEVTGGTIGPVTLKGYYGYTSATETAAVMHAAATIDMIKANAYVTNFGTQADADARHTNFTVDASATPVSGIDLAGVFSYDAEHEGMTWKANTTIKTIPNFTITGLVRMTDGKYSPKFTDTNNKTRVWWADEKHYEVGASTTQSGVTLSGSFALDNKYTRDDYTKTTTKVTASTTIEGYSLSGTVTMVNTDDAGAKSDSTTTDLSVGKKFGNVNVKYTGKIFSTGADMQNTVTADTTVNTPFADNVKIEGIVRTGFVADTIQYGIDAAWKAPVGVDLRVGYSNYNWRTGGTYVNMSNPNGFFVRAYTKVSF